MKTTNKSLSLWGITLACLMLPIHAAHAAVAGQVQFAIGNVQITTLTGVTRPLSKGDAINEGDSISTALSSSAQIKMQDGGFVAIRPDTQMKFDKFVFSGKQDGEERSYFSLLKGGFRAVTGLIGKTNKQNYKITTPAATIGIRGTDHETFVVPVGNPLVAAGAYSKVNVGETTLTTNQGTVNVQPNQMGYSSGMNAVPKLAPINTDLFTVAAAPTKTIKESKEEKKESDQQEQKAASKDGKTEQASSDKQSDKQNDKQAESNKGAAKAGASDSGAIRTATTDNAPLASNMTPSGPTPAVIAAPITALPAIRVVPITLADSSGFILNTSTQAVTTTTGTVATVKNVATQISSGSSLAAAVVGSLAYTLDHIEVQTASQNGWWNNSMAALADMTYVTGAAGGLSSSGALSSVTFRSIAGGSGFTDFNTISGGTATSANTPSFATTGIQYGAWSGYTGQSWTYTGLLGGINSGAILNDWMYGAEGYLDAAYKSGNLVRGAMAGTFTYQLDGSNAPYYLSSGRTGTLDTATLTANFSTMKVSASLGLTMPGNDKWGISLVNQALTANPSGTLSNFVGSVTPGNTTSGMTVTHGTGTARACTTCGGDLGGAFTGQNYAGAIIGFYLYDNAAGATKAVQGNAALSRNFTGNTNPTVTNGTAAATGNYVVGDGQWSSTPFITLSHGTNTTAINNVLSAYSNFAGHHSTTVTCATCTSTATGQVATSGIYYGNWASGSYTISDTTAYTASITPSYWITGPEAGPLYLPQALIGTANYTFDAGQVSNSNGIAGTIQGTSALTLNFTKQSVGINLDINIADTAATPVVHTWNAKTLTGDEAALQMNQGIGGAAFSANPNEKTGGRGLLTVSVDGSTTTGAYGDVSGKLTGSGLTGAIINFSLANANENIIGVAAFSGSAQSTATSHQYVSISSYNPATTFGLIGFYANNSTRITQDAAGNLTQFDMQTLNSNGGVNVTFTNVTGTLSDHGSDPVSGISWGRWAGGTYQVTDRLTSSVLTRTQTGSTHWITESAATSAVTLPISGTYTYTKAGGTSPTDNLGNVGTLNSATLTANFTAQTVNMGVNATVNGATLNATGTNAPIIQKTAFYASSMEPATSSSYLTVTCTGTCGTAPGGTIVGKFTGTGATGATMTYGLQHGQAGLNGGTVVSGVVAFHK